MDFQPDWDTAYEGVGLASIAPQFRALLDQFGFSGAGRTALEIGCFPGGFIRYFGERGYRVSGIDTYPGVTKLHETLCELGITVGAFENISLDAYIGTKQDRFDLVFSMGFIEHFKHFPEILYQHVRLATLGGVVLVGAPNFATPLQRAMHQSCDQKNLDGHHLAAMYPLLWKLYMEHLGVDVRYCSGALGFDFWSDSKPDSSAGAAMQQFLPKFASVARGYPLKLHTDEPGYSILLGVKREERPRTIALEQTICALAEQLDDRDERLAGVLQKAMRAM